MGTVPTPHTWTAGDNATSANMQTLTDSGLWNLGSSTSGGSRKPLFVAVQTVAQTAIASGTAITFDSETGGVDYDNGHSTTTNPSRYTANTAGWYDIETSVSYAGNTTGSYRAIQIRVNGTTTLCEDNSIFTPSSVPNVIISLSLGTIAYLNVGDYVEVVAAHNATSLNTLVNGGNSRIAIAWRSN